jgi:hypothetical protein
MTSGSSSSSSSSSCFARFDIELQRALSKFVEFEVRVSKFVDLGPALVQASPVVVPGGMRPSRPATAQSRLSDIKAEWQASVLSSGAHSRAQTPDLAATRPGSRGGAAEKHRAQVAQARSRLQELEAELHRINRSGARAGSRAESPSDGPREPASLQDEVRGAFVCTKKDDLVASHARQLSDPHAAPLPNAVENRDGVTSRQGTLPPIAWGRNPNARRNSASSLRQQSASSLTQYSVASSLASSPRDPGRHRPPSGRISPGPNIRRVPLAQHRPTSGRPDARASSPSSSRPRSGSLSSVQFSELLGNRPMGEGGWIAYDDIREIINEETKKVLSLHTVNKMHKEKKKNAGWVAGEADAMKEGLEQNTRSDAAATAQGSPRASKNPGQEAPRSPISIARLPGKEAKMHSDGKARSPGQDIPKVFSDGRANPYYLLRVEQARTMTIFGFGGFSRHSLIRSKMILILNDGYWQALFNTAAILNGMYIAVFPSFDQAVLDEWDAVFETVDASFMAIFYSQMIAGWIAWGFYGRDTAWWNRDFFHRLEFLIFLVSVYEQLSVRLLHVQGFTLRPLLLLRIFKAMIGFQRFASVKSILFTIYEGSEKLVVVFGIFLAFLGIFAVYGMGTYRSSFSRRCVMLPVPVPACASDQSTDWNSTCTFSGEDENVVSMEGSDAVQPGYPWVQPCKIYTPIDPSGYEGEYPKTAGGNYHTCQLDQFRKGLPVTQVCEPIGNPQSGYQHFDDISGAVLATLQVAIPGSSYDVLHLGLQSESDASPTTYVFILCISVFLTFLVSELFLAVVIGTFASVREQQAAHAREREVQRKKLLEAEWDAWDSWRAERVFKKESSESASHAGFNGHSSKSSILSDPGGPGSTNRPPRPSRPRPLSAHTLGLRWQDVGQDPPRGRTEIRHEALEELIQTKLDKLYGKLLKTKLSPGQEIVVELTKDEYSDLNAIHVCIVTDASCVKVGDRYLVPAAPSGVDDKEALDDESDEEEGAARKGVFLRLDVMARAQLQDMRLKRVVWATIVLHVVTIAGLANELNPVVFYTLDIICNVVFVLEACCRHVALKGLKGVLFNFGARNEVILILLTLIGYAARCLCDVSLCEHACSAGTPVLVECFRRLARHSASHAPRAPAAYADYSGLLNGASIFYRRRRGAGNRSASLFFCPLWQCTLQPVVSVHGHDRTSTRTYRTPPALH